MNTKFFYQGKSLRQYCIENGINYNIVFNRIKMKNLSVEDALHFRWMPNLYFMATGQSVTEFCRENNLNIQTVRRRIREGHIPELAIKYRKRTPPSYTYPSVKAACENGAQYNRALRLIRKGLTPKEAIIKSKKNS